MTRIAYLGPPGTFTEEAIRSQPDLAPLRRVPTRTVPDALGALQRGEVELAVVPIENSIEGTVNATLDTLSGADDLLIQREIDLGIHLVLAARPGTALGDVRAVLSHPTALPQCRQWLAAKLPDAEQVPVSSTSEAARLVARSKRPGRAAVANAYAVELHGLDVLASGIEDHEHNVTRFVAVGRGIPAATGHDKTSIVCYQREDRPGSLLAILSEFASRSINLTKLESRPTKRGLGDYCFFIDCEGHVTDGLVADVLKNLAARQAEVKFLGSYPVAGEEEAHHHRRVANRRWRHAERWLEGLQGLVRPTDDLGEP